MSDQSKPQATIQAPTVVVLPQPIEHMELALVIHGEDNSTYNIQGRTVHALVTGVSQRREFLNSPGGCGDVIVTRPVVFAVCSKNTDEAYQDLRRAEQAAFARERHALEHVEKLKQTIQKMEHDAKAAAKIVTELEDARKTMDKQRLEIGDLKYAQNKLEGDLGRVRKHIGSKAFDEALKKA